MPYLFLLISVISNSAKGYGSKRVSAQTSTITDSAFINIMRNVLCCVISFFIIFFNRSSFLLSPSGLLICLVAGVTMSAFMISWNFAVKTDAYMLVSACSTGSFIIPCIAGYFFFNEQITATRVLSFGLICLAIYFLMRYNCKIKSKLTLKQIVLLATVLVSQGLNQLSQKLFIHYAEGSEIGVYTFYTFITTAIALIVLSLFMRGRESMPDKKKIHFFAPFILLMSIGLFGASYFQTLAAKSIDSIILYPLNNALSLISGILMSCIFFKEKINRDSIIGIIFAFVALILSRA